MLAGPAVVFLLSAAAVADCRRLGRNATPTSAAAAPATQDDDAGSDIDTGAVASDTDGDDLRAQIAAAVAQFAVKKASEAKVNASVGDFVHHCKAAARAALDKEAAAAPMVQPKSPPKEAARQEDPFADQVEASERKQLVENEEFLLGLLNMHERRRNWSTEQELDAICNFAKDSPAIKQLYFHHDAGKSLAMQLAAIMDSERKTASPTRAPPLEEGGAIGSVLAKVAPALAAAKANAARRAPKL